MELRVSHKHARNGSMSLPPSGNSVKFTAVGGTFVSDPLDEQTYDECLQVPGFLAHTLSNVDLEHFSVGPDELANSAETVAGISNAAQEKATQIVDQANAEAQHITSTARGEAEGIISTTRQEASDILNTARHEAFGLVSEARAEAENIIAAAREQASVTSEAASEQTVAPVIEATSAAGDGKTKAAPNKGEGGIVDARKAG